ncbi:MAG TPA: response regulator transcription factor [Burkholderiaceae bacterium]|nr:response regulator transcription factor [Burkholderiaceae bacterium]HQR72292.1 response regulator transcription factor [Burkholderiaceae bacterium]
MIRLLLADGQTMVRQGLARLLVDEAGLSVCAEAEDDAGVIAALRSHRIDVALLDRALPGKGGIALIRDVKALQPAARTLLVSPSIRDPHLMPALHAGTDGYITKESAAEELVAAVRRLAAGGRYICPVVAERQTFDFVGSTSGQPDHMRLSHREYEVFRLLVAGRRGADIASELSLSEKTVSSHKASLLRKLHLTGVAELVQYAIRHDLAPR